MPRLGGLHLGSNEVVPVPCEDLKVIVIVVGVHLPCCFAGGETAVRGALPRSLRPCLVTQARSKAAFLQLG